MTKAKEILEQLIKHRLTTELLFRLKNIDITELNPRHYTLIYQALTELKSGLKERIKPEDLHNLCKCPLSFGKKPSNACLNKVHQAIDDFFIDTP